MEIFEMAEGFRSFCGDLLKLRANLAISAPNPKEGRQGKEVQRF
jgi:hypothetical protein